MSILYTLTVFVVEHKFAEQKACQFKCGRNLIKLTHIIVHAEWGWERFDYVA